MKKITNFENSKEYRNTIHKLIPGGAHTYSKGDDQFPILSPAAIKHGLGAYVWDLDDNKYLDCSMGLSSVSLGHAYQPVLDKVIEELKKGVNFQRPSYIERDMAKIFLSLVPGHDMIKFAKNGSSATTAAVKLARAYNKKDLVVFPSDHPFYSFDDWFISKTACDRGIPEHFKSLSLTYDSTNLETLKDLFKKHKNEISCLITEPLRSTNANATGYLKEIADICKANDCILIFDEMVTGFKVDLPGAFTKYGVTPDLATWGKGIANGFSFCALTGRKEIMELGGITNEGQEKLFLISTTHGGETHAIAAGIATIEEFKRNNVVAHNHKIGRSFNSKISQIIEKTGINEFIKLYECDWMPTFMFKDKDGVSAGLRTLMLQEMITRGVLFQGIFVPCYSHQESDVDFFCEAFSESIEVYKKALTEGWQKYLVGNPAKAVFRKIV